MNKKFYISGSLPSNIDKEMPKLNEKAKEVCDKLIPVLLDSGEVHTAALIMRLGAHIINALAKMDLEVMPNNLKLYPFSINNDWSADKRSKLRETYIDKGDIFLMLGGTPGVQSGAYAEYMVAKKLGKLIIPIPCLGGAGSMIYDEICAKGDISPSYVALGSDDVDTVINAVKSIIAE